MNWGGGGRNYGGIAHKWASQTKDRGKNGNIFFEGTKIYSYGHHFCMARFLDPKTVLVTTKTYSPSTGSHQRVVADAVRGLDVQVYKVDRIDPHEIEHNLSHMQSNYDEQLKKASTARACAMHHIEVAMAISANYNRYAARFKPGAKLLPPIDKGLIAAAQERTAKGEAAREARQNVRAEKNRIAREEREQYISMQVEEFNTKHPGMVEAWNSGEMWRRNERLPNMDWETKRRLGLKDRSYDTPTMLRLIENGKTIETSRGARVPVAVAPWLWKVVESTRGGVDRAAVVSERLKGTRIGDFELREIKASGDLIIGCHALHYDELARMAKTLELT